MDFKTVHVDIYMTHVEKKKRNPREMKRLLIAMTMIEQNKIVTETKK